MLTDSAVERAKSVSSMRNKIRLYDGEQTPTKTRRCERRRCAGSRWGWGETGFDGHDGYKILKTFILLLLPCLGIKNAVRTLPADKFQTAFSTASIR